MSSPLLLQIPTTFSPSRYLTPSFRESVSHFFHYLQITFSHRRPWPELIDSASFSRPQSLSIAISRLRRNLSYFRINYLALVFTTIAFSLLSHPLSLLCLLFLAFAWIFLYFLKPSEHPTIVFGRAVTNQETLGFLIGITFIVVFFTSIVSLIMYAMIIGGSIVCFHGAFRDPDDLFLDKKDRDLPTFTGLFSIANGASTVARDVSVV